MSLISVIIPCYNVASYLDRCVQSLFHQTIGVENLQLIFINDASTDNTLDLLYKYERQHPDNILVINCEENGKQGRARNIGMQYATCDYIGFVDSDDWIELTMFEKLYQKAKEGNYDIVACQRDRLFSEKDANPPINGGNDREVVIKTAEDRLHYFEVGLTPNIWTKIYRKSMIFNNNIFFPEKIVYEDNYWGGIIDYYFTSAYVIDEILYHWYVNPSSTTMLKNNPNHFDRLQIEELKYYSLVERGFYDTFQRQIKTQFLKMFYFNSLKIFFRHFDEVPIEIFSYMKETVKRIIPDYATYCDYTEIGEILIELLDINLDQAMLNEVQKNFLKNNL